jgi:selenocysteine lyase/cysteine desulfurase
VLSSEQSKQFRSRFRIFEKKTYLNSCSQGALGDHVESALKAHLQSWNDEGSPWDLWVEKYEEARTAFAKFIGAKADEVAVVSSVSSAVSTIASALSFDKRRRVVMGAFEFPTMGQVWLAQERRGAQIHFIEPTDGRIDPEAYAGVVDERTLIVPVAHVCFLNGFRSNPKEIVKIAHRNGALAMLDDYQDAGTRAVNVKELDVDFYVAGTLKYLLSPSGMAFLYVRPELIQKLIPTITGWFAQREPFAFDVRHFDPAPSARRFEHGSPPVPQAYATIAALELLSTLGFENIASHIHALTKALLEGARSLGIKAKTPDDSRGPLVVLQMQDIESMATRLAEQNLVVSRRMDGLRISFHAYNTMEDVRTVLNVLEKNIKHASRIPVNA